MGTEKQGRAKGPTLLWGRALGSSLP